MKTVGGLTAHWSNLISHEKKKTGEFRLFVFIEKNVGNIYLKKKKNGGSRTS